MIYNIWKVKVKGKRCCLAFHVNGSRHDTCENGMELRNGTSGKSYLHIPQFTLGNQGVYLCETAYWGGTYNAEITVSARVPPQIFSRLDELHNSTVAVCSAVGGNPAASISWRTSWNSTANQTSIRNPNGTYTVEGRLVLPDRVSRENLSCIVTHLSWPGGFKETLQPRGSISVFVLQFSVLMFGVVTSCYILWRPSKPMRFYLTHLAVDAEGRQQTSQELRGYIAHQRRRFQVQRVQIQTEILFQQPVEYKESQSQSNEVVG